MILTRILISLVVAAAICATAQTSGRVAPARQTPCYDPDVSSADAAVDFRLSDRDCFRLDGGFSGVPGSFVRAGYSHSNLLHLGETLGLSAEVGVRLREIQFSFVKPSLLDKPIQTGFTFYGRRFSYNQDRESSIFAFQPDIPVFSQYPQDDLLRYVSNGYGLTGFVQYAFHDHFSRVGLGYSYDVSSFRTLTDASYEYFGYFNYQNVGFVNRLSGIRTSKLTPSFSYNTVDQPAIPTQGMFFGAGTAVAGLGGDVNTVEPKIEVKYFRRGFRKRDIIGAHALARVLIGYGNNAVTPPFDRYYMGGENDIRGLDSWSIGPIAYMPSVTSVNVLNNDGSPRVGKQIVNGVVTYTNVTMQIPIYRPGSIGGDTNVVLNVEYRIPIRGPFAMTLFSDVGVNRASFLDNLQLNPGRIELLNAEFPGAGFGGHFAVVHGTNDIRMSAGPELQVMLPPIHAPLRFYWAYNPLAVRQLLDPPQSAGRTDFPNAATYLNALNTVLAPTPLMERRFLFRFAIGRTF